MTAGNGGPGRVALSALATVVLASGRVAAHGGGMGTGGMAGGGGLFGGWLWMGLWLAVPVLLVVAAIRALDGRREEARRPRDRDPYRERPD